MDKKRFFLIKRIFLKKICQKKTKSIKLKFLKQIKKYYINPDIQLIKCQES
jgi:hypothetical protein